MAIDRNKVLEAAQQELERGNYENAITELRRLVDADPRDVRALLKIGDLQTRMGSVPAAIETYLEAGALYEAQGTHLKTVAIYKQVLKLDPDRADVLPKLASTYLALGLSSEALSAYDHLATLHLRDARVDEAAAALSKGVELVPDDVPTRIKLAEALSRAGDREGAAAQFEKSAERLKAQGLMDDYLKVAERLLFHRQDDVALARELASEYLDRGEAKRALGRLQLCFKRDPRDVTTLALLARAFQSLGQTSKAISVHREIAKLHEEAGRGEALAATLKAILALDPGDEIAQELLEKVKRAPVRTPLEEALEVSAAEPPTDELEVDDEPELELITDDDELLLQDDTDPEPDVVMVASDESDSGPDEANLDEPEDPLTEARSFARLGLWPRVVEAAEPIAEADPEDVDARLLLSRAYEALGQTDDAVDQLLFVAEIFSLGDPERAAGYLRKVLQLDPENIDAKLRLKGVSASPASRELDEAYSAHDIDTTPPPAAHETITAPPPPLASPDDEPILDEPILDEPGGRLSFGDVEIDVDLLEPISPEEFEALPTDDAPAVSAHVDATELEEVLEEADFYISQALFDEARETLEDALEEHPGHPLLTDRLAEIEALAEEAAAHAASAEDGSEDAPEDGSEDAPEETVDEAFAMAERLAGDLAEEPLMGGDMLDADVVFEQFKKGVAEAVDESDSATHFDLGIAYREMGLFEDAVREFEIAGRAPARTCNAYSMAGLCQLEAGRFGDAIDAFRVALEAPIKAPGEEVGLHYELGNALELFGDDDQALVSFKRVAELDPNFRDVKARIDALGDVDAAFDGIFSGD